MVFGFFFLILTVLTFFGGVLTSLALEIGSGMGPCGAPSKLVRHLTMTVAATAVFLLPAVKLLSTDNFWSLLGTISVGLPLLLFAIAAPLFTERLAETLTQRVVGGVATALAWALLVSLVP